MPTVTVVVPGSTMSTNVLSSLIRLQSAPAHGTDKLVLDIASSVEEAVARFEKHETDRLVLMSASTSCTTDFIFHEHDDIMVAAYPTEGVDWGKMHACIAAGSASADALTAAATTWSVDRGALTPRDNATFTSAAPVEAKMVSVHRDKIPTFARSFVPATWMLEYPGVGVYANTTSTNNGEFCFVGRYVEKLQLSAKQQQAAEAEA